MEKGKIVKVEVKENLKELYWPNYLHSNIGYVLDIDDEHIYLKCFRKDINGNAYVTSMDRYCLSDVTVEEIDLRTSP